MHKQIAKSSLLYAKRSRKRVFDLVQSPVSLNTWQPSQVRHPFSSWQGHGTDLLNDSLAHNYGVPKIILNGHSETGFDIVNMVKNVDPSDNSLKATRGIVHCSGSVLVFPGSCYLWKVRRPQDITVESLAPVLLYRPALEYLFLGSAIIIPPKTVQSLREGLNQSTPTSGTSSGRIQKIVVEQMDLTNAMGTFNILNGEDRRVAVALILPPEDDEDGYGEGLWTVNRFKNFFVLHFFDWYYLKIFNPGVLELQLFVVCFRSWCVMLSILRLNALLILNVYVSCRQFLPTTLPTYWFVAIVHSC